MSRIRPRTRRVVNQKKKARKQWIAFFLILTMTVSALIAIAIMILQTN